jgi:fatty-acyl-CoA synthase
VEVAEVLTAHDSVYDAVVVGVPDEKFGEAITAIVEAKRDQTLDDATLIAHVKQHLAGYKAPKRIFAVDSIGRAPNGKVDYARWKGYALDRVGA